MTKRPFLRRKSLLFWLSIFFVGSCRCFLRRDLFMFFLRSRVVDQAVGCAPSSYPSLSRSRPPTRLSHGVSLSLSAICCEKKRQGQLLLAPRHIYCQKGLGFLALSQGYWPFSYSWPYYVLRTFKKASVMASFICLGQTSPVWSYRDSPYIYRAFSTNTVLLKLIDCFEHHDSFIFVMDRSKSC